MDLCKFRASLVYIEFQVNQDYMVKCCFNSNPKTISQNQISHPSCLSL